MRSPQNMAPNELWSELHQRDPESAQLIPPADIKRVIRAFELLESREIARDSKTTTPILYRNGSRNVHRFSGRPDVLRARIRARVDSMVANGLIRSGNFTCIGFRNDGITAPQARSNYKEIVAT